MLGKKKPVDDWFSDLWTNARITQHLSLLCAKYLRMNFFSFLKSSPSEGIWPLKLCVNPNALWYQLPLPLSIFFHIPEIILTKVKKKKNYYPFIELVHLHYTTLIIFCNTLLKSWPGKPYQWPPSLKQEWICNSETLQLPGSLAWADETFQTFLTLHQSQN